MSIDLHVHRWEPAVEGGTPILLLLHGTGGDENDLIPLARMVAPRASLLSVRGNVLEQGMPRFFRRLREGVFDQEDLRRRTLDLADFVEAAEAKARERERQIAAHVAANETFVAKYGSLADEFSEL